MHAIFPFVLFCVCVCFSLHLIFIVIFPQQSIDEIHIARQVYLPAVRAVFIALVDGKQSRRSLLNSFFFSVTFSAPQKTVTIMFSRFASIVLTICLLCDAFGLGTACRLLVPAELLNGCIFDPMIVERNSEFDSLPGHSVTRQNCNTMVKKDLFGAQPLLYYGRARSVCGQYSNRENGTAEVFGFIGAFRRSEFCVVHIVFVVILLNGNHSLRFGSCTSDDLEDTLVVVASPPRQLKKKKP